MDQKWRDSLDVAAAKSVAIDYSGEFKRMMDDPKKGESERPPKKGQVAGVYAATVDAVEKESKTMLRTRERGLRKCKFSKITGCTSTHPPWLCKTFGNKTPEEGVGSSRTTSCVHSACFMVPRKCATRDI